LCGRYCDSSLAYQGYGRGLNLKMIQSLNRWASGGIAPDLTLLLDIAPEKGLPRAFKARGKKDRIESEEMAFHRRLRKGFLEIARKEPSRVKVISASQTLENVEAEALKFIIHILSKHSRVVSHAGK
jgi:dTMP kinase